MRVLISLSNGEHVADHAFTHRMVVDGHGLLIDLAHIRNSAVDSRVSSADTVPVQ